jgi:NADPH:quinone reductase-like Zn-dependent oxidoreductase
LGPVGGSWCPAACRVDRGRTKGQNPLLALAGPLGRLVGARRVLFPIPTSARDDIEFLGQRLADGNFAPVIDRTYSLEAVSSQRPQRITAATSPRTASMYAAPEGRTGCLLILC